MVFALLACCNSLKGILVRAKITSYKKFVFSPDNKTSKNLVKGYYESKKIKRKTDQ